MIFGHKAFSCGRQVWVGFDRWPSGPNSYMLNSNFRTTAMAGGQRSFRGVPGHHRTVNGRNWLRIADTRFVG